MLLRYEKDWNECKYQNFHSFLQLCSREKLLRFSSKLKKLLLRNPTYRWCERRGKLLQRHDKWKLNFFWMVKLLQTRTGQSRVHKLLISSDIHTHDLGMNFLVAANQDNSPLSQEITKKGKTLHRIIICCISHHPPPTSYFETLLDEWKVALR